MAQFNFWKQVAKKVQNSKKDSKEDKSEESVVQKAKSVLKESKRRSDISV